MKAFTWITILLMATTLAWGGEGWLTDFEKAKEIAKKTKRPILVDFTGSDWCIWCVRLDREVFSKASFKKYAKDNLVLLMLDFPQNKPQTKKIKKQNERLAKKYKIEGYPTVLLLDADGNVKAETGYRRGGPNAYVAHLKQLVETSFPAKKNKGIWFTNFKKAQEKAKREGKVIFADFTGSDWCGWCIRLDREVLSKPAFINFAEKKLVLLKLDFPAKKPQSNSEKKQNKQLARKYGIRAYPTILLLDANGKIKGKTGYRKGGAVAYVAHLKAYVK